MKLVKESEQNPELSQKLVRNVEAEEKLVFNKVSLPLLDLAQDAMERVKLFLIPVLHVAVRAKAKSVLKLRSKFLLELIPGNA